MPTIELGSGDVFVDLGFVADDFGLPDHSHIGVARGVGVAEADLIVPGDFLRLRGTDAGHRRVGATADGSCPDLRHPTR